MTKSSVCRKMPHGKGLDNDGLNKTIMQKTIPATNKPSSKQQCGISDWKNIKVWSRYAIDQLIAEHKASLHGTRQRKTVAQNRPECIFHMETRYKKQMLYNDRKSDQMIGGGSTKNEAKLRMMSAQSKSLSAYRINSTLDEFERKHAQKRFCAK